MNTCFVYICFLLELDNLESHSFTCIIEDVSGLFGGFDVFQHGDDVVITKEIMACNMS